jgi:hypothetical protein
MLERLVELYDDEELLKADGFDEAVIGICTREYRLIYSMQKCIDILVAEGMTEEDALDHFYYNVEGSWVGEKTPIFCEDMV